MVLLADWQTRDLHLSRNTLYLLSLCFFIVLKRDLFVYMYHDDSLTSYHVNQTTNYHTIICTTSETEDEVVHVKLV